jgi:hypothetical protein
MSLIREGIPAVAGKLWKIAVMASYYIMRKIVGKSAKYLTVSLINLAILCILLALWTDDVELTFNPFVRPLEFLKILVFGFLSLIAVRLYSFYLRKKGITTLSTKIKGAVVLTILISLYLYIVYAQRIVSNVIINGPLREQLAGKIKPCAGLANGTQAAGLTIKEYQTIVASTGFPPLPPAASNIEYRYQFDGFLPDYSLRLIYDVPPETPIATYDHSNGRYSNSQSVDVIGGIKRATYFEWRQ